MRREVTDTLPRHLLGFSLAMSRMIVRFFVALLCVAEVLAASAREVTPTSSTAERVYAAARPKLLQIRTLLVTAGRQSSIGSGFLVSAEGLAVTNYHVVAQYAQEPSTYRMEYAAPDGAKGNLKLLAIDVANDLAVVSLDGVGQREYFQFYPAAVNDAIPKGERLYAMGNPLDLGFTIVEGTYNSLVEKSYQERVHFSGAINAGMSGGPTVSSDGRVAGINVAKQIGGELVSFLVPAKFGVALLQRARDAQAMTNVAATRSDITGQLSRWQDAHYRALLESGFKSVAFGRYRAPESQAPWFTCWARTNAEQVPKPRATQNATQCTTKTWLYVTTALQLGSIDITHVYAKSVDLNRFQFTQFVAQAFGVGWTGWSGRKHVTGARCVEEFVKADMPHRPALRVVWCARALRDYPEIYDVALSVVTQDRSDEALVSKLAMSGVSYANALAVAKRFLAGIEVSAEVPQ